MRNEWLRQLPSVRELAESMHALAASEASTAGMTAPAPYDPQVLMEAARVTIESWRAEILNTNEDRDTAQGEKAARKGERSLDPELEPTLDRLQKALRTRLDMPIRPFRRVLNATGVLLHTNLGRAPLGDSVWQAMREAAGYCDVEMDVASGQRASRLRDVDRLLTQVTGAEAGMVVNNNAAAVLLALAALAKERPTAISRGHLVEIGGGFRLPSIMQASGSPLLEIGTANRTHLSDYEEALRGGVGLVLVVHRSNFSLEGYVTEPGFRDVVDLCRRYDTPVVFDLGSGALVATAALGLPEETSVQEAVAAGFDLVCFSGDKIMGGPQAGYLVGRCDALAKTSKHPLARALRCDKIQLAGCLATLELYQRCRHAELPIFALSRSEVRPRAEAWRQALGRGRVVEAQGVVGGGSLPEARLQGWALALEVGKPDALLRRLRGGEPAVVAHIEKDVVLLHPQTVPEADDQVLIDAVRAALLEVDR